jgi:hypothetical protein
MGNSLGVEEEEGIGDALDDLPDFIGREEVVHIFLEIFFKVALFAEFEDEVVIIGGLQGLVQFDDVGVLDAFDDDDLLGDHFLLFLGHVLDLDHFYRVFLDFAVLAALEDLACRTSTDLLYQFVVPHLF